MPRIKWRKLGASLLVAFAFGCTHSGQFNWSPSLGTPDLTRIDEAKWDEYVGRIVQVRGPVMHYKRGPVVAGLYIDGTGKWPQAEAPVVVTGTLVRHDERVQSENGAQVIGAVYYSLSNVKWSRDN